MEVQTSDRHKRIARSRVRTVTVVPECWLPINYVDVLGKSHLFKACAFCLLVAHGSAADSCGGFGGLG